MTLRLTGAALILAFSLLSCASKPDTMKFGYVDKSHFEMPLLRKKNTVALTGKANFVIGKSMPEAKSETSSIEWSCKLQLEAKIGGNVAAYQKRIHENLAKQGLLSPELQGDLFLKSSLEKQDADRKQYNLRLADLMGSYKLQSLAGSKEPVFVNKAGYVINGFVASTKGLGEIELVLSLDPTKSAEDMKNVLCSEIQEGVQFHPQKKN